MGILLPLGCLVGSGGINHKAPSLIWFNSPELLLLKGPQCPHYFSGACGKLKKARVTLGYRNLIISRFVSGEVAPVTAISGPVAGVVMRPGITTLGGSLLTALFGGRQRRYSWFIRRRCRWRR